jgi:hypothetical protein
MPQSEAPRSPKGTDAASDNVRQNRAVIARRGLGRQATGRAAVPGRRQDRVSRRIRATSGLLVVILLVLAALAVFVPRISSRRDRPTSV